MNKLSIRSLPAAVALTATLAFSAHAQVTTSSGVRTGANTNITSQERANAGNGASMNSNMNSSTNNDGAVTRAAKRTGNAVKRTGNKVEGAVENAADATRNGAYRAKNAVGNVANKADRGIQNHLPGKHNAGPAGQVNVEGSGNVSAGSGVARPPQ